jgi:hypothetical protein
MDVDCPACGEIYWEPIWGGAGGIVLLGVIGWMALKFALNSGTTVWVTLAIALDVFLGMTVIGMAVVLLRQLKNVWRVRAEIKKGAWQPRASRAGEAAPDGAAAAAQLTKPATPRPVTQAEREAEARKSCPHDVWDMKREVVREFYSSYYDNDVVYRAQVKRCRQCGEVLWTGPEEVSIG